MDAIRALLAPYLKAVWRNRWLALLAAWTICGAGWAAVTLMPNQYESSARLYVDTDAVLTPLLKGLAVDTGQSSQLDVLQRTLLSKPNVKKLISKTQFDLTAGDDSERERLVARLQTSISVKPEATNLFTISYRNADPRVAFDVVNQLLTIFIESATGTNRADMENARLFLQRQINSYEGQLREAERRVAEFRTKFVDLLLPENAGPGGVAHLDQARLRVQELTGQLKDAVAHRDGLRQELTTTKPLLTPEQAVTGGGSTRLADLQRQLLEALQHDTESHPDVVALRALIAATKRSPGGGSEVGGNGRGTDRPFSNPVYDSLKVKLVDAEATVVSLTRQVEEASAEQRRLDALARQEPEVQAQYQNLNRDYTVLRTNYEALLARRESANIAQAADTQADKVKLQVIDPPQVSRLPVSPNRLVLLTGVLLAGLGGGLGIALLLGHFDKSFRSIDDLRGLGLPVLGGLSMVAAGPRRRGIGGALAVATGFAVLGVVYGGLVARALRATAQI